CPYSLRRADRGNGSCAQRPLRNAHRAFSRGDPGGSLSWPPSSPYPRGDPPPTIDRGGPPDPPAPPPRCRQRRTPMLRRIPSRRESASPSTPPSQIDPSPVFFDERGVPGIATRQIGAFEQGRLLSRRLKSQTHPHGDLL